MRMKIKMFEVEVRTDTYRLRFEDQKLDISANLKEMNKFLVANFKFEGTTHKGIKLDPDQISSLKAERTRLEAESTEAVKSFLVTVTTVTSENGRLFIEGLYEFRKHLKAPWVVQSLESEYLLQNKKFFVLTETGENHSATYKIVAAVEVEVEMETIKEVSCKELQAEQLALQADERIIKTSDPINDVDYGLMDKETRKVVKIRKKIIQRGF